ncbi:hypothetical protein QTP86_017164 [Hemibagrus guttatus]|nr:hypothetical protein QTP86_017164 [Hemibagrus guttatus]
MGLVFYPLPVHGDVPYRLRLPAKYRICPTFHVSLLKPVYPSAEGAPNGGEPPPPLDIEGSPAYRLHLRTNGALLSLILNSLGITWLDKAELIENEVYHSRLCTLPNWEEVLAGGKETVNKGWGNTEG